MHRHLRGQQRPHHQGAPARGPARGESRPVRRRHPRRARRRDRHYGELPGANPVTRLGPRLAAAFRPDDPPETGPMPTHGPHPAPPLATSRLAAFLYFGQLPCQRRSVPFECGDELHAQHIATRIETAAADSQPNAHRARNVRNELVVQMLFDNVLVPDVQYGPS